MILVRERARTLDISIIFSWFIIYSAIGWLYETTYCYLTTGNLTNRGFLFGPLCPIYGISIVLMILLTDKYKSMIPLFLVCALVATVLEYFSSYWMELVFHRRWWNYSDMFFNINGRICLGASVLFGICGVIFVRFIHPAIVRFMNRYLSEPKLRRANKLILFLFLFDILLSIQTNIF